MPSLHRIVAAFVKRMASANPTEAFPRTNNSAALSDGFDEVLTAGWTEPAVAAQPGADR
jgi:hypothetical protein